MNLVVQIPNGPALHFAPSEARGAAAYMTERLPRVGRFQRRRHLEAIHDLELATTTENHFDVERFTPTGYVPGWVKDP